MPIPPRRAAAGPADQTKSETLNMKKRAVVGQLPKHGGEEYRTRKEMAAKFGVGVRTIDNWRRNYDMPHYCVGGQVRFKESQVEAWAETMRRGKRVPGMV